MQSMIRLVATALLLAVTATGGTTFAQAPQTLSYQGYLTDSSGQALQDSLVVEFSIYAVETGGVPLWSEFQSVFPSQGLFSTTFGSATNPFPPGMFDTPLYLGIKVNTDDEMTPRPALTSAAYAFKAHDASTLEGLSPADLDQSSDVATLASGLGSTQADVASVQTTVGQLGSDLSAAQGDLATLTGSVGQVESDVALINLDVADVENDVSSILGTLLPGKQDRIIGTCGGGTYIDQIYQNGAVHCVTDLTGPWSFDGDAYVTGGTRVGIGTTAPAASLMIDSPVDEDPFRARVASSTKLRVHANGSVSLGTSAAGPVNGLHVAGQAGIGTSAPNARLAVADSNWQFRLFNNDAGGGSWYMGSSATAWSAGAGKFVLNSTDNSAGAAFVIDANKNVGISNTAPSTKLHILGGSDVNPLGGGYLTLGSDSSLHIAMDNNEIMARNNGTAAQLALNAQGGEVTINSGGSRDNDSLEIRGRVNFDNGGHSGMRITATNSNPTNALFEPTLFEEGLLGSSTRPFWRIYSREFYAQTPLEYKTYSDRSLKSNIARIQSAMETINALEGVTYELSTSPMGKRERPLNQQEQFVNDNQLGFIAQDVAKVLPQLVTEDETTGLKTVAYMGVIPVLVEALKEQQKQLDAQRAELDELKARLK